MLNFFKYRLLPEYAAMLQPKLNRAYSPTAPTVSTWNQPQYAIQPISQYNDEEVKGDGDR